VSFLASFAAFFSLGDIAGFFLNGGDSVPTAPSIKAGYVWL
jgi:hypothetical protein